MESQPSGVIELRLSTVTQLFNSLDPSPFRERDLDDDAEAYILGWARELPPSAPLKLVVHLPESELALARDRGVEGAFAYYFRERERAVGLELKELFRVGRRNLGISVPLLVACLLASHLGDTWFGEGAWSRILSESLVIVGWVANWRPIETFLYDWWPLARRRELYRRLAAADVELRVRG